MCRLIPEFLAAGMAGDRRASEVGDDALLLSGYLYHVAIDQGGFECDYCTVV